MAAIDAHRTHGITRRETAEQLERDIEHASVQFKELEALIESLPATSKKARKDVLTLFVVQGGLSLLNLRARPSPETIASNIAGDVIKISPDDQETYTNALDRSILVTNSLMARSPSTFKSKKEVGEFAVNTFTQEFNPELTRIADPIDKTIGAIRIALSDFAKIGKQGSRLKELGVDATKILEQILSGANDYKNKISRLTSIEFGTKFNPPAVESTNHVLKNLSRLKKELIAQTELLRAKVVAIAKTDRSSYSGIDNTFRALTLGKLRDALTKETAKISSEYVHGLKSFLATPSGILLRYAAYRHDSIRASAQASELPLEVGEREHLEQRAIKTLQRLDIKGVRKAPQLLSRLRDRGMISDDAYNALEDTLLKDLAKATGKHPATVTTVSDPTPEPPSPEITEAPEVDNLEIWQLKLLMLQDLGLPEEARFVVAELVSSKKLDQILAILNIHGLTNGHASAFLLIFADDDEICSKPLAIITQKVGELEKGLAALDRHNIPRDAFTALSEINAFLKVFDPNAGGPAEGIDSQVNAGFKTTIEQALTKASIPRLDPPVATAILCNGLVFRGQIFVDRHRGSETKVIDNVRHALGTNFNMADTRAQLRLLIRSGLVSDNQGYSVNTDRSKIPSLELRAVLDLLMAHYRRSGG